MSNARQGKAHSSYKRRCHITITAPAGVDAESELMQRFVGFMNRKMMLNTDTAWIIEAMFQRFISDEGQGEAASELGVAFSRPARASHGEAIGQARANVLDLESSRIQPTAVLEEDPVGEQDREDKPLPKWAIMG